MNAWTDPAAAALPLIAVNAACLERVLGELGDDARAWCDANRFDAGKQGRHLLVPGTDGTPLAVLVAVGDAPSAALAGLPHALPAGEYRLDSRGLAIDEGDAALAWALGAYRFERYRRAGRPPARLTVGAATRATTGPLAAAVFQVRDLVNTPTEDLGPEQLAAAVRDLAGAHGAEVAEWVGDELPRAGFPAVHAVGRASHRPPRVIRLQHGAADAPHVVLVGKGVCFDTGGLDIKGADGMRWMKKDMGGAAHAIALASLVLQARLPVRLSLIIPAVENAIGPDALRPGEVIATRQGLRVEVDNTDAEGRLILCDALTLAAEDQPDLILDFATLTGAARIALGPELPALFCNDEAMAGGLLAAAEAVADPLWRMPLWQPYRRMLDSHLADMANSGPSRHAGSITAALYLERFIPEGQRWAHIDVYAWNDADRPGHPRGGEAQGLRACFAFLRARYG